MHSYMYIYIYIYIRICIHIHNIYIYIYIYSVGELMGVYKPGGAHGVTIAPPFDDDGCFLRSLWFKQNLASRGERGEAYSGGIRIDTL